MIGCVHEAQLSGRRDSSEMSIVISNMLIIRILSGPDRPIMTDSGVQKELTWPSFSKVRPKPTLDAGLVFFVLGGPRWARVGPAVGFCLL